MNTIFNELIDNFNVANRPLPNGTLRNGFFPAGFLRTDAIETDGAYILSIDAPGIARSQIDVNLENGTLRVSAEFSESKEAKDEKSRSHITERAVGRFERKFRMPKHVSKEDVKAKLEKGVLTITIAKPSEEQVRAETQIAVS